MKILLILLTLASITGSLACGSSSATTQALQATIEAAVRTAQPSPTPTPPVSEIQAKLDWVAGGVAYTAKIKTSGSTGEVEVEYVDPIRGVKLIVREDLRLQDYQGNRVFQGFNPRWVHDGSPALPPYYYPDTFRLAPSPMGGWSIVELCDTRWVCAPVTSTPLR